MGLKSYLTKPTHFHSNQHAALQSQTLPLPIIIPIHNNLIAAKTFSKMIYVVKLNQYQSWRITEKTKLKHAEEPEQNQQLSSLGRDSNSNSFCQNFPPSMEPEGTFLWQHDHCPETDNKDQTLLFYLLRISLTLYSNLHLFSQMVHSPWTSHPSSAS